MINSKSSHAPSYTANYAEAHSAKSRAMTKVGANNAAPRETTTHPASNKLEPVLKVGVHLNTKA